MPTEGSTGNPIDVLGSARAKIVRGRPSRSSSPTPASTPVIVLFVPTVGIDEDEVGAAISRAAADAARQERCSARSCARRAPPPRCRASRPCRPSRIRRPRRGRSAVPPSAATGCGVPAGTVPELVGRPRRRREPSSPRRCRGPPTTRGSTPRRRGAARGLRPAGRARARRRDRRGGGRGCGGARVPGRREERSGRRAQDGVRRRRPQPRQTRPRCVRPPSESAGPCSSSR